MNKTRRKEIGKILECLYSLQSDIESVFDEEEEYKDNMPENLQNSERYYMSEEACDNLDSALNSLQEVIDYLSEAMN